MRFFPSNEDIIYSGVLGMAASMDLEVEQLDVKTVFLHGYVEEEIYMLQLKVLKLKVKKTFCAN